jgi:hypothetical protein
MFAMLQPLIPLILFCGFLWAVFNFVFKPVRNLLLRDPAITAEEIARQRELQRAAAKAEAEAVAEVVQCADWWKRR